MRQKIGSGAILVTIILLTTAATIGVFAWFLPHRKAQLRLSNERTIRKHIQNLIRVQADFRANDRDGNGRPDYWTGDLAGLHRFGLIERGMAEADANPLDPLVPQPLPFHGYYFMALRFDESETPPVDYRQDTDSKSGKVHHLMRFGFVAYPAEPRISGNFMWIINENNTTWQSPAGLPVPKNWPKDDDLKLMWNPAGPD